MMIDNLIPLAAVIGFTFFAIIVAMLLMPWIEWGLTKYWHWCAKTQEDWKSK